MLTSIQASNFKSPEKNEAKFKNGTKTQEIWDRYELDFGFQKSSFPIQKNRLQWKA